jgi:hypothetical protein
VSDFDHRLTPEGREGFLAAIGYVRLAANMAADPQERGVLIGIARALTRKADQEYLIGKPSGDES